MQRKSLFLPELKEALSVAVPGVRDIRVVRAGSYYVVELRHERDGGTPRGSWFDLSYESDGTIRLLAMLTILFQDHPQSLIGLEEPELGIPPRSYGRFGRHNERGVAAGPGIGCHPQPRPNQPSAHREYPGCYCRKRLDQGRQSCGASVEVRERQSVFTRRTAQHGRSPTRGRWEIYRMTTIIPVVEGDGDVAALPILLSRILLERYNRPDVVVAHGKTMVVKANGRPKLENRFEDFLQHAQNKPECDSILVLLDTDVDCPVELARSLLQRCKQLGLTIPVEIVCAHREYESWFLASLDTIRGQRGISDTATLSQNAEDIPDPKHWLTDHMPYGQAYKENNPSSCAYSTYGYRHGPQQFTLLSPAMSCSGTVAGPHILTHNLSMAGMPKLIDQPVELTYHSCHRLDVTLSQPRERFRDPRHRTPIWKSCIHLKSVPAISWEACPCS